VTSHADLAEAAARWRAQGRPGAVVAVTATRGSVPREAGTRMLVGADAVLGTIGGGHLEFEAIALARGLLARPPGAGEAIERRFALGPSLGQCCGGVVHLRIAPLAADPPEAWPPPAPRFQLGLFGAGHVGRAIATLLAALPCRVRWVDEREAEFPATPGPAHIERVTSDDLPAEVASPAATPPGACVLVLTHSHALDLEIVHAALRRPDLRFVGLIGSRSKRARFEHRLRERGIAPAAIERLVCPIGLPGIAGKEPEVIALAVVAQLLALPVPQRADQRPVAMR
jgi:xanthine dehydrogenase accessory factor